LVKTGHIIKSVRQYCRQKKQPADTRAAHVKDIERACNHTRALKKIRIFKVKDEKKLKVE